MMLLWRVGTPTIGLLRVLAVVGTAGLWGSFVAPAIAQNAGTSAPEVSVDLDVLNSLDPGPTTSDGIILHPPSEGADISSEEESGPTERSRPGRRAKASTTHAITPHASNEAEDDADRGAASEATRESHRKPRDAAKIKRQEAERLRQAKAEIEEAARRTPPPQKTATAVIGTPSPGPGPVTPSRKTVTTVAGIPNPGPGPVTPPPPNQLKPGSPPGPVASTAQPAAPPTSRPAAPAEPKRAALVKGTLPAPHIDFVAGTSDLTPAARSALDAIAKALASDDSKRVQLVAYATGNDDEANQARRLSLSRALNVRGYLIDHGVRNTRMDVRALGNRPAAGNKPADRVDIVFLDK
jgi:outer membrane protein OmpA-like peptidoglycan-associated protein